MNKIISVDNVHFAYDKREILCTLNFIIDKGDFFVLSGDNGSGKSTLLKLILGLLKPQMGTITLHSDKIGYVSQSGLDAVKDFPASVYEVVAMRLSYVNFFNINSEKVQSKVFKALTTVGILDLRNSRISELSGGQLQRVLIAKELVNDLDILLLDEPTSGLDQKSIQILIGILNDLNHKGLTIGMVSHYVDDVKQHVNKIYELKNKHIYEVKL